MGAKALFTGVLYGSKLAFQSLGLVTQTSLKRRQAKSAFKKTLIAQGLSPETADEIAQEFPNPISELFSILKSNAFTERKQVPPSNMAEKS
ncbi:MAG: hypothetical protein CW691_08430 [Candidatus Bathyarchaeum sp.]|nr:MAG: hypothetical protein CW691_08430 [Candidatus Bathyarchaeum sp.]